MTYFVHTTVGCHGAQSILGIKLLLNQSTFHDPIWKLELLNFQPSLEINFLPMFKYIMIIAGRKFQLLIYGKDLDKTTIHAVLLGQYTTPH